MKIFKFCHPLEWEAAQAGQIFYGSEKDKKDGFLHFSISSQIAGTLTKHYANAGNLVLIAVDSEKLGDELKWEPSREGEVFPHLYGPLHLNRIDWAVSVPRKPNGAYALPPQAFVTSTNG